MLVNGNITEVNVISIYQISEKQFSRVLIGSRNLEYPWQFTVLLFISSLLYHNYLLPYLHIYIYSSLFLHFALEFARCPYRILQINYVDVDTFTLRSDVETNQLGPLHSLCWGKGGPSKQPSPSCIPLKMQKILRN